MAVNKNVLAALKKINETGRATQKVGEPLVKQGLIEVNLEDVNDAGALARLTPAGLAELGASAAAPASEATGITLLKGIVLPESKRGFGREAKPSKYPFATMEAGDSFFVGNSEVEGGDALKKLGSTVSNANNKYRHETGDKREVTRKVKGGSGEKETVTLPVYKADKKFTIRPVKKGFQSGAWSAPDDGVIIQRTI